MNSEFTTEIEDESDDHRTVSITSTANTDDREGKAAAQWAAGILARAALLSRSWVGEMGEAHGCALDRCGIGFDAIENPAMDLWDVPTIRLTAPAARFDSARDRLMDTITRIISLDGYAFEPIGTPPPKGVHLDVYTVCGVCGEWISDGEGSLLIEASPGHLTGRLAHARCDAPELGMRQVPVDTIRTHADLNAVLVPLFAESKPDADKYGAFVNRLVTMPASLR